MTPTDITYTTLFAMAILAILYMVTPLARNKENQKITISAIFLIFVIVIVLGIMWFVKVAK